MKLSEIKKITHNLPSNTPGGLASRLPDELKKFGIDPGNFYQELEMDSLYVDTHRDISYSNSNIHFHSHAFYEIICCHNTCGAEYLVNSERYKLQKGDIIFVPPGISHRPLLPDNLSQPYSRDVLWVSESFMNHVKALFPHLPADCFAKAELFRSSGTHWEYICELFRTGVAEAENAEKGWEAVVYANTMTILAHLTRASADLHRRPMRAEKPELLDSVLTYVELHLSEKLSLAEVAHQFYVSESTITQTFRKKWESAFTAASPSAV